MTDVIDVVEFVRGLGLWALLVIPALLIVVGALPTTTLRWIVRVFPDGHQRREQLLGDLYDVPFAEKWLFVALSLEVAAFEGLPARLRARRAARAAVVVVEGAELLHHLEASTIWSSSVFRSREALIKQMVKDGEDLATAMTMVSNMSDGGTIGWVFPAPTAAGGRMIRTGRLRIGPDEPC